MANRRVETLDVHELVRLKRLGTSHAEISRLLGRSRQTVVDYVHWATTAGLLEGPMLDVATVQARLAASRPEQLPPQQVSSLAAYEEEVRAMRAANMELAAIRSRLEERHQVRVSYEALRRLVRRMEPAPVSEVFVRIETAPGEEAQVDFGYAGPHVHPVTGEPVRAWVFVMVLSWSRHMFARVVFDQTVSTWLECHRLAFEFFGGVPRRIVLDNLKAGIIKACRDEPEVQRAYREFAEHYGFLIDPNPPRRPNLKGKVEQGGVHYVYRNFLAGREPERADGLNDKLRAWCLAEAGQRRHGTTQVTPLSRFTSVEQAELLVLPTTAYDMATWKQAKLHHDCHLAFERGWYSAPYRLVGQRLWVRGGTRVVRVYTSQQELVAIHDRAQPGERRTQPEHLPSEKVGQGTLSRATCRARAAAMGPATLAVVEDLLAQRPVDKMRVAGRVLELANRYGTARVEAACRMALDHGEPDYQTVKTILQGNLDQPQPAPPPATGLFRFARAACEYVMAVAGGAA